MLHNMVLHVPCILLWITVCQSSCSHAHILVYRYPLLFAGLGRATPLIINITVQSGHKAGTVSYPQPYKPAPVFKLIWMF